ncbi:hypothetical protein LJY25_15610 [Hymenobacter sp. BT175]|nr:hypothetical protein [Hymenobacter translucens]
MRTTAIACLLFTIWSTSPASAQLRPWPLWSTKSIAVDSNAVAVQREWKSLHLSISSVRSAGFPFNLGWKRKYTRFKVYNFRNERVSPHKYSCLIVTPDGLLIGKKHSNYYADDHESIGNPAVQITASELHIPPGSRMYYAEGKVYVQH